MCTSGMFGANVYGVVSSCCKVKKNGLGGFFVFV